MYNVIVIVAFIVTGKSRKFYRSGNFLLRKGSYGRSNFCLCIDTYYRLNHSGQLKSLFTHLLLRPTRAFLSNLVSLSLQNSKGSAELPYSILLQNLFQHILTIFPMLHKKCCNEFIKIFLMYKMKVTANAVLQEFAFCWNNVLYSVFKMLFATLHSQIAMTLFLLKKSSYY